MILQKEALKNEEEIDKIACLISFLSPFLIKVFILSWAWAPIISAISLEYLLFAIVEKKILFLFVIQVFQYILTNPFYI